MSGPPAFSLDIAVFNLGNAPGPVTWTAAVMPAGGPVMVGGALPLLKARGL